ncbi:D-alanyl-D-alanine carboxypeptidase family protein [Arthrobacter sp. D1-17]
MLDSVLLRWRADARRFAAVVVVLALFLAGAPGAQAAPAGEQLSTSVVTTPTHPWVLVNKSRPLNPIQFVPSDLVYWNGTGHRLRRSVSAAANQMFTGARAAGHSLEVISGYRSYATQRDLYNYYVQTYGQAYADQISARPGHSEHQTGLAMDVGNVGGGCGLTACFGDTAGGRWVAANAHRYGFIVRYPQGYTHITGYAYEPWHLRYVGVALATDMKVRSIPTMEQFFSLRPTIKSAADVLAADSSGALWNYPANGRGGYGPRVKIASAGWTGLKAGFVADWNSDGINDIVAQWNSGRLAVYRGKGAGGFLSPIIVGATGWQPMNITVGKWHNGHRYPGVVGTGAGGVLVYYRNTAGGALSTPQRVGFGFEGTKLTMADFDNDRRQDLLVTKPTGELLLYRSDGSARLLPEARRKLGNGWHVIAQSHASFGFLGTETRGLAAKTTDGRLFYYGLRTNQFTSTRQVGNGWGAYSVFR